MAHTLKMCDTGSDSIPKFPIVDFPFLCSNISAAPSYSVYISQLIRYSRACSQYYDFLDRARLMTDKLLRQGYVPQRLRSSLQKFNGRRRDLVDRYGISVSQMKTEIFPLPSELTWSARRVSYKKQEMLTLRVHLISPQVLRDPCRSSFYRCSFGYCIVLVCMCLSCSDITIPFGLLFSWLTVWFLPPVSLVPIKQHFWAKINTQSSQYFLYLCFKVT